MTNNIRHYARVDESNICQEVIICDDAWIAAWSEANPGTTDRWIVTRREEIGYAGVGFSYREDYDRFMSPAPDDDPKWVFDDEVWGWFDSSLPPEPEPSEETEPEA